MKGKRFDAAEKHFLKKEQKYKEQLQRQEAALKQLRILESELRLKNSELVSENASLQDWVERLLGYTGLRKEDIKEVCEQDKKRGEVMSLFMNLSRSLSV